ncbi:MAG: hypothetical protein HZB77_03060 [Chloroflexi bacterium]|nr:hypothetical protein [Chloroflexota bacterium]MBI5348289.1 hypothetical protein [Chloroflexota bacterium]
MAQEQTLMNNLKNYTQFQSNNPRLDFTFLYPDQWQVIETKGKETEYDEVFIAGPRNQENTFSLALIVRVTPSRNLPLESVLSSYLTKNMRATDYREVSRTKGTLAGIEAIEIEISYTMLLPLNSIKPQRTSVNERRIFFEKDERLYELIYTAAETNYNQYLESFKNAARTFEFREESDQHISLVLPMPAHAVRERPARYKVDKSE